MHKELEGSASRQEEDNVGYLQQVQDFCHSLPTWHGALHLWYSSERWTVSFCWNHCVDYEWAPCFAAPSILSQWWINSCALSNQNHCMCTTLAASSTPQFSTRTSETFSSKKREDICPSFPWVYPLLHLPAYLPSKHHSGDRDQEC